MLRGPLGQPGVKTRFAGHETFPLRRLWLRKAYDAVRQDLDDDAPNTFDKDEGIIRFGVGKNMVGAIKHWALACGIVEEDGARGAGAFVTTGFGDLIFDRDDGLDPFMESLATTWLLHWRIASNHERATTWYYAFNHLNVQSFDRESIAEPLRVLCSQIDRSRASSTTIKRDVECFIRSYAVKSGAGAIDDQVETVLGELGLLREISSRSFAFRLGPKPSLPGGVFLYALSEYWAARAREQSTLAIDTLVYEPGSPGRIFKLDEDALIDRLVEIEEASSGAFLWTDSAGVRAIARRDAELPDPSGFLAHDFPMRKGLAA